jgi:hypothetical protein
MLHRNPLFRLFGVTLMVLFMGTGVLSILRWMGTQNPGFAGHHAWMQKPFWKIAQLEPTNCTDAGVKELLTLDPSWMIWIDVSLDHNNQWHLICPAKTLFSVQMATDTQPLLAPLLPLLAARAIIFNVHALDSSYGAGFIRTLGDWTDKKVDIGIATASQSLVRDLRKKQPEWLFAADGATWSKLKLFTAFHMESVADLWADFYVASFEEDAPNSFSLETAREIMRRKKVLILEWNESPISPEMKNVVRGVLTKRPKSFSDDTFFKTSVAQ